MVANMAMESVEQIFAALTLNYSHLESFYDVLAVVFAPAGTLELDKLVPAAVKQKKPYLAKKFVGQLVEFAFRNRGQEKLAPALRIVAREAHVSIEAVEPTATGLFQIFPVEVQTTKCRAFAGTTVTVLYLALRSVSNSRFLYWENSRKAWRASAMMRDGAIAVSTTVELTNGATYSWSSRFCAISSSDMFV